MIKNKNSGDDRRASPQRRVGQSYKGKMGRRAQRKNHHGPKLYRWSVIGQWFAVPRFYRYLFIGGVNTAVSYGFFLLMIFLLGHDYYQWALFLQYALFSLFSFTTQKILVFSSFDLRIKKTMTEYIHSLLLWGGSYGLNALLLWLLVWANWWPLWFSQVLLLGLVAILRYYLFQRFVFYSR